MPHFLNLDLNSPYSSFWSLLILDLGSTLWRGAAERAARSSGGELARLRRRGGLCREENGMHINPSRLKERIDTINAMGKTKAAVIRALPLAKRTARLGNSSKP